MIVFRFRKKRKQRTSLTLSPDDAASNTTKSDTEVKLNIVTFVHHNIVQVFM